MVDARRLFGNSAEDLAARYLKGEGFKIIARQFKTNIGEIDLVARDGDEVVFVEVKARRSSSFGYPEESVTAAKLRKIGLVAEQYIQEKKLMTTPWRIDVVAILFEDDEPSFHHVRGVG